MQLSGLFVHVSLAVAVKLEISTSSGSALIAAQSKLHKTVCDGNFQAALAGQEITGVFMRAIRASHISPAASEIKLKHLKHHGVPSL